MGVQDWFIRQIGRRILQRKAEKTMGNLFAKIDGQKTYVTSALGMVLLVVGHFWGPLHLGPIDVPQIDAKTMWEGVWAGIMAMTIRHGVTKSGPTQ